MLGIDVENLGNLLDMNILVYFHSVCLGWQLGYHRTDVVVAVIVHNIVGCDESWYISTCFLWKVWIDFPVICLALGTMDSLVYLGWSAVVGCNNEVPVVEDLIEIAQVVGCGIRCLHWVAALIVEGVYLQTIALACAQHELPKTCSSYAGNCLGVECRLDNRQIFQFQWQVICFQCLLEDRHVEVAGTQHEAYRATKFAAVAVDELLHYLVVWHFNESRESLQSVDIYLCFENRIHITVFARGVGHHVSLCIVEVKKAVEVVFQTFRNFDFLLLTVLVGYGNHIVIVFCIVVLGLNALPAKQHRCCHDDYFLHYLMSIVFYFNYMLLFRLVF